MKTYLLLFILLAHVIDDFYLQGVLANLKQKKWWRDQLKNDPDRLDFYQHDWLPALVIHAACWSICIHLPIILLYGAQAVVLVYVSVIVNAVVHGWVDHLKCNKFKINLVADQLMHVAQILLLFIITVSVYGV